MSDSTRDRNVPDMNDEPSNDEPLKDETSAELGSDRVSDSRKPGDRESPVQTGSEAVAASTPTGREPMRSSTAADDPSMRRPVDSDGWRELSDVEQRFHELEAEFIREPQAAVKKAETLIEEAVERITRQLHDEVARVHGHAESSSDTEQLRVAMLGYKTLIESIRGRRAA